MNHHVCVVIALCMWIVIGCNQPQQQTNLSSSSVAVAPETDSSQVDPPASSRAIPPAQVTASYPESKASEPLSFKGQGNEPYWNIDINPASISFGRFGEDTVLFPTASPIIAEGLWYYAAETDYDPPRPYKRTIEIIIKDRPCNDTMADGPQKELAISIIMDFKAFLGCAEKL